MLRKLLTLLILFIAATAVYGQTPTQPTTLYPTTEGTDDPQEKPKHGHRMPPAPVICIIDIENGTISGTSPLLDNIEEYQLWDADGEVCLISTSSKSGFFDLLRSLPKETYMIKLVCGAYSLTGELAM